MPVVRMWIALAVLLATAVAGCSGGDEGVFGDGGNRSSCRLVERVAESAEFVERADISDPEAFRSALDDAVLEYGTSLEALRKAVPDELRDDLDQLRAAAEQYRFEDGFEARANLDEWAEQECADSQGATATTDEG